MKRIALSVVVLASSLSCCWADDEMQIKPLKGEQSQPVIKAVFDGIKDGVLKYHTQPPPVSGQIKGSFNALAFGSGPAPVQASRIMSIKFDGEQDWLSVTMKNGDFIKGQAESLKAGMLRLKGVEKPIRLMNVKEISATESPEDGSEK